MAQSLSQHEWKNRVILLFAPAFENSSLQKQMATFQKDIEGLKDRKLIIYQITPNDIEREGNILEESTSSDWFKKFVVPKNEFTFILIGLDGGKKMRSSKIVSLGQLFRKIDQMPMRRAEIRKQ